MMKRFICVLIVIIFFALPLTLHADIVMGNEIYNLNEDNAEEICNWYDENGRSFIINSSMGYVVPKEKVGSKKRIYWGLNDGIVLQNGEITNIKVVVFYQGKYWGVNPPIHSSYPAAWFLMDDLLMVYQREDFEKENEDRIYAYTGNTDAVLSVDKLVVWQWPGSDREKKVIEDKKAISECDDILFGYKDSEGREWGKSNDAQGWICLSDPENNSNIPMFNPAPEPVKWSHEGSPDWTKAAKVWPPAEPMSPLLMIVIASAVLVIIIAAGVTAGLVLRAKTKKKRKETN